QALSDCDKAAWLAGNLPEIADRRADAAESILAGQRMQRQRAMQLAAARDHIDNGRLSRGEKLLANVGGFESRAAILMQDLNAKRSSLEAAIKSASAALDRDDLETAAREVLEARAHTSNDARIATLIGQLTDRLAKSSGSAIETGRLDLAETLSRTVSRRSKENTSHGRPR